MTTQTLTAAQIVDMITPNKEWTVKSVRKSSNDGYSKVVLTNKGDYEIMAETKVAKYFLANSRAHQIKAAIEWNRQEEWLAKKSKKVVWSSNCLPSTEGAVFLVRSYIRSITLLMDRMVRLGQFTPQEAVKHGNDILAMKQNPVIMIICDEDKSFIKEILELQAKLGKI